jgi:hypothetical protein
MAELNGGKKLEQALESLARKLERGGTLRVGFLEGATYPDGTPVAMVAALQNFGAAARGIPPRPFFTNMIAEKSERWASALAALLKRNDFDVDKTLRQMGAGIKGQLQQAIVDMNSPPLSPITLMLRKMRSEDPDLEVTGATVGEAARRVAAGESTAGASTKPLIDTTQMINSVDYEVTGGG